MNTPTSKHPEFPSILRYFLQIQSLPPVQSAHSSLPNSFPPLNIDISALPIPPRQEIVAPMKAKKEKKQDAPKEGVIASVVAVTSSVVETATAAVGAVIGGADPSSAEKEGKKKEKKEKPAKATQPSKEEPIGPMPSMIDMRVGKVLDGELLRLHNRSLLATRIYLCTRLTLCYEK